MKMYSHANKSQFYKKDFALSLILKVIIRRWPIFVKGLNPGNDQFLYIYIYIYKKKQLPFGLLAQLVREVKSLNPVQV